VQIKTPETDPGRGLVKLTTRVADPSRQIAPSCAAFAEEGGNKFIVTGRGGLPPSPDGPLSSDVVWSDTRLPNTTTQSRGLKTATVKPPSKSEVITIVPATGWVLNGNGEVMLVSSVSNEASQSLGSTPAVCVKQ
jgi:large exoprotein involved in heme utilization and adhesion